MAEMNNRYIAVQYKLFTVDEKGEHLVEQTTSERPFDFISGFGYTLEAFEEKIKDLEKGQTFTFAMNGQSGKFVGNLPIDGKKLFAVASAVAVGVGAVAFAVGKLFGLI